MNWGRAKTILIMLFVLADIFLAIVLMQTRANISTLSEDTISATVQVLKQHNISLDASIIPEKRVENRNVIMQNHFDDPVAVAKKMLREFTVQKANEAKMEYQFESETAFLKVSEARFYYSKLKKKEPYKEGNEPSAEAMAVKVLNELSRLGFHKKDMVIANGHFEHGIYSCQVLPTFSDAKIYGIKMQVTADRQELLHIEGSWFKPDGIDRYTGESLMDITSVLSAMVYREDFRGMHITGIETAYYAGGDYLQSREIEAVPVYVVTTESGKQLFFDGRTGNEIKPE